LSVVLFCPFIQFIYVTVCDVGVLNCTVTQLKSALLMNDAEFLDKFEVLKPRQDDANVVFYGRSAGESAPAVEIAHELGFTWFAENFALS